MKICLKILCTFILSATITAVGQTAPFSLELTAKNATIKAGSDVWVSIRMTNVSDRDINCSVHASNGVDLSVDYKVTDGTGRILPRKVSQHPELEGAGSIKLCTLSPNESIADDSLVSRLFDMSNPGEYVIRVSRHSTEGSKALVKSNEVRITVTP